MSPADVTLNSSNEVSWTLELDVGKAGRLQSPDLKSGLRKKDAPVGTDIRDNFAKSHYMKLGNTTFPMFALDDPNDLKAHVLSFDKNINIMSRSNALDRCISSRIKT